MNDYFKDDEYWKEHINKKLEEDLWIDEYLLNESNFDIIFETEKHETGDNVIGEDGNDAIYIISRKRSWFN